MHSQFHKPNSCSHMSQRIRCKVVPLRGRDAVLIDDAPVVDSRIHQLNGYPGIFVVAISERPIAAMNAPILRRDSDMHVQEYCVDTFEQSLGEDPSAIH